MSLQAPTLRTPGHRLVGEGAEHRGRRWGVEAVKYFLLIALSAIFMLPLFWMLTSALKDIRQIEALPPVWIPNPAYWNHYWEAWTFRPFTLYTINTIVRYALPYTLGTVLSSAIVAYGFSRLRWPGRDLLFLVCLMTMMVPFQVRMVPLFIVFKQLGWINSFRPLVVPAFFGAPYFIFLLRQFFMTIPSELSDAARIDGSNELGILFKIILPLAKPALTVVALFSFLQAWNNYLGPLIYINRSEHMVLAVGIANLSRDLTGVTIGEQRVYPYLMAVSSIATIPILLAYFFVQRTFIEGISLTGLKG